MLYVTYESCERNVQKVDKQREHELNFGLHEGINYVVDRR